MSFSEVPAEFLPWKGFINGQWIAGKDGKTFPVKNPANGQTLGEVPDMGEADTEAAITAARAAFDTWGNMPAKERAKLIHRWADLAQENLQVLAKIITAENGKPSFEAEIEVAQAIGFLHWYAEESRRTYGDVVPTPASNKRLVFIRQPAGVAGLITPWNFPAATIIRKAVAAIAAGCTAILKPSEDTPITALALAKLAAQAEIPPGVLNIVTCSRPNAGIVGKALCESTDVAKISFTGSTATGKKILAMSASTVKKVSLELGGNAPFIVFDSANVDLAVGNLAFLKFYGTGQVCISANRIMVQEKVYDEFCTKLAGAVKDFVVGDGSVKGTRVGPLINEKGVEKVERHVKSAIESGGKVLLGGKRHALGGNFFEPTIISDTTTAAASFQEEIFGPLAVITKFKTEDEALAIANNCRQGLAGYFFSENLAQAWRVAEKLETGMVGINTADITSEETVFGGVKESGLGREGGKYCLEEFMNIKYMCFGNV